VAEEAASMPERHESCCAVYNEPAYPNGPCDCKYREQNKPKSLLEMVKEAWRRPVSDRPSVASEEAIEKAVAACMRDDR
jgi:hypothetical protein